MLTTCNVWILLHRFTCTVFILSLLVSFKTMTGKKMRLPLKLLVGS